MSEAGSKLKGLLAAHFLKTMDDLYSYSYLMTNPSFMTQLEIGDKVLVMGSLHKRSEKRVMSVKMKEGKYIPKIKVYLNKNSIDRTNIKKEEERKNITRFFRERKQIWKSNERRMEYKEKLMDLLNEANKNDPFYLRKLYQCLSG